jgi:hypothetical protein
MSDPTTRPLLVIDDDGELFGTLAVFEEILSEMQPLEEDKEAPAATFGPDELNAVHRVLMQLGAAEQAPGVELYDPVGRFHYVTLRVFCPLIADLDAIGHSIGVLSEAARSPRPNCVVEKIEDIVWHGAVSYITQLGRAYRTLPLDADDDHRLLCQIATRNTGRFVMDADQEGAYRRYSGRVLAIGGNDPLERFLFGALRF